jgi:hypothetical protein
MTALSLVISAVSLIVSITAWRKSRAIYGVERAVIRQYRGTSEDLVVNENHLNETLSSGNYSILAVMERKADRDWEILLGRIKPYMKRK